MAYKAGEHIPLMLFGIFVAPLSVFGLINMGSIFAYELAAVITMLVGVLVVVGAVQHWRYA